LASVLRGHVAYYGLPTNIKAPPNTFRAAVTDWHQSLTHRQSWLENRTRPAAIGRANWLFTVSLRAGKRAAIIMSIIQFAKFNGLNPYDHLHDVHERLRTK
jgi:hypothetical protein